MKSVDSVGLLVILADVLGSILKGLVCLCLLLGLNIGPFPLLDNYKASCIRLCRFHSNIASLRVY